MSDFPIGREMPTAQAMKRFALPLLAAPLLAGCDTSADFPSLALRPIEKIGMAAEPPATPEPAPGAAPLGGEAEAAVAAAEESDRNFRAELASAETAVSGAQGSSVDSEAWVAAQETLSRAESARAGTAAALATLDAARLAADRAPTAALLDAIQRITALDRSQADALSALIARLPQS